MAIGFPIAEQEMSKTLQEELRQAIRDSGLSALQLSKETGAPQPSISDFLRGKDIRLATAQKIADYLGLKWCKKKKSD